MTLALVLIAGWLVACGSNETGVDPQNGDPPIDGPQPDGGRVYLENLTRFVVESTYLNRTDSENPLLISVDVDPDQRLDISGQELPGGEEVEFDLVLDVPPDEGFRVRRKASVMVDGDVELQISLEDTQEPFDVRIDTL